MLAHIAELVGHIMARSEGMGVFWAEFIGTAPDLINVFECVIGLFVLAHIAELLSHVVARGEGMGVFWA